MDKNEQNKFLLSPIKAAAALGLGRDRIRKIIKNNPDAPVIKLGERTTKVIVPEFEKWLIQAAKEGRDL